jgi:toxin ParE1/3/4
MNLVEKIEMAITERLSCPLSFEPFQSNRKRKNPYYRIYVDHFTVYYVVMNEVVEIRRLLYNGREAGKIIK